MGYGIWPQVSVSFGPEGSTIFGLRSHWQSRWGLVRPAQVPWSAYLQRQLVGFSGSQGLLGCPAESKAAERALSGQPHGVAEVASCAVAGVCAALCRRNSKHSQQSPCQGRTDAASSVLGESRLGCTSAPEKNDHKPKFEDSRIAIMQHTVSLFCRS